MWVSCEAAKLAGYVPVFAAGEGLPEAYTWGECGEYDLGSAWWAFQEIGELCYRRYDEIANDLVIPVFDEMQQGFLEEREKLYERRASPEEVRAFSHAAAARDYANAGELGMYNTGRYL